MTNTYKHKNFSLYTLLLNTLISNAKIMVKQKRNAKKKKWGKIGDPGRAKRKAHMKKISRKIKK